ncbi:MAG: alpha/beta hydrolase-fold protein [Roseivirga sp.]
MKQLFILILLTCLLLNNGFAQSPVSKKGEEVVTGKTYTFLPEKLAGSWQVQVSLPPSYRQTADSYPVVYALHGNFYFNFAVGGLQRLMEFGNIPEVIIVGITNESNGYFAFGSEGADQFLDFMETDIFPFVEQNFRTHRDRTVMGWHYTSGFIFHALSTRPQLFQNYLPASPYLGGYDINQVSFNALADMAKEQPALKKQLYFGVLNNERTVSVAALGLDSLLQKKAPANLDWEFHLLEPDYDKFIEVSVYRLWRAGLKTLYAPYRAAKLEYQNLDDFKAKGGLAEMRKHYAERAIRYGGVSKPPGLVALIRLAERADDFPLFEELMTAYGTDLRPINTNRLMGFADFYLKHGKAEKAIALYKSLDTFYPNSVSVQMACAEALMAMGNQAKAKRTYRKAIALAEVQGDQRKESLEKKLAQLR